MNNLFTKALILAFSLTMATSASAKLTKFDFTMGGFSNGGSVTGSFKGEDLNNDGFISSFLFKQDIDFLNNDFEVGMNEVTSAELTFNGFFDAGRMGADPDPVTTFSTANDLTDLTDEFFPGFPLDLFFLLNYDLNGGNILGDGSTEGFLMGTADQPFVFGTGRFLPAPAGIVFDSNMGLAGGSTLTSKLIQDAANGTPCINGLACGVVHSVIDDPVTFVGVGGFDMTSGLLEVVEVSAPGGMPLFGAALAALFVIRLRNSASV